MLSNTATTSTTKLLQILLLLLLLGVVGDHGSTVVKALPYKPEGRWFDPS